MGNLKYWAGPATMRRARRLIKVARAIGLGYPEVRRLDKLSKEGDAESVVFPKAKLEDGPYDFSFSGVKSAVLNHLNHCRMQNIQIKEADIAASFQKAVVDTLVEKSMKAAEAYHMKKFAIAGGVASNQALRTAMQKACEEQGLVFYHPSPIFCTDNAAMIGWLPIMNTSGDPSWLGSECCTEPEAWENGDEKRKMYRNCAGCRPGQTNGNQNSETISAYSGQTCGILCPGKVFRRAILSMKSFW